MSQIVNFNLSEVDALDLNIMVLVVVRMLKVTGIYSKGPAICMYFWHEPSSYMTNECLNETASMQRLARPVIVSILTHFHELGLAYAYILRSFMGNNIRCARTAKCTV